MKYQWVTDAIGFYVFNSSCDAYQEILSCAKSMRLLLILEHLVWSTAKLFKRIPSLKHFYTQINKGHLRKAGGYSGRNGLLNITKMRTTVQKIWHNIYKALSQKFRYTQKKKKKKENSLRNIFFNIHWFTMTSILILVVIINVLTVLDFNGMSTCLGLFLM